MTEIWRKGDIYGKQDIANMPPLLLYLSLKNVFSQTTSRKDKTELKLRLTFTQALADEKWKCKQTKNILDFGCQTWSLEQN